MKSLQRILLQVRAVVCTLDVIDHKSNEIHRRIALVTFWRGKVAIRIDVHMRRASKIPCPRVGRNLACPSVIMVRAREVNLPTAF